MPDNPAYTIHQLCTLLGVSDPTVRAWVQRDLIVRHGATIAETGRPITTYRVLDPKIAARLAAKVVPNAP